jgi:hypothetical protein
MKVFLTLAISALFANAACAQKLSEKDIPAVIVTNFKQSFPDIKKATWEKEDDYFEAEFALQGQETSATFDVDGKLLETETEIRFSDLPAPVKAALATSYKGAKVKETARLISPTGTVTYEAEVAIGSKSQDLVFDAEGHEVKE